MIDRNSSIRLCLLLPLLAVMGLGCDSAPAVVVETPPPPVAVSKPITREVIDQDDYEGRIEAVDTVEVRARVRGHLLKVNFEDGQMVKKGDVLFEIDPRSYQATLDAANAQLKAAEAALQLATVETDRTEKLVEKRAASREELDVWKAKQATAAADVLKAKADIEQAQLDLDFTKVIAEIDGKIGRALVTVGNLVNTLGSDTLLTTITSIEPMYVYFDVDERSLLRYQNQFREAPQNGEAPTLKELKIPVHVALDNDEDFPHQGVVDFADNHVNPSTGTIQVRGVLPNPKRILGSGMRARVRVPVSDPYQSLLITERAVGTDQGHKYVYVVGDDNVAHRRDVTLGRLYDGMVVVAEGLKADEPVIVNGILRVRDGMKVQPQSVPMPGAAAEVAASANRTSEE